MEFRLLILAKLLFLWLDCNLFRRWTYQMVKSLFINEHNTLLILLNIFHEHSSNTSHI
jgi:hypothetical protein